MTMLEAFTRNIKNVFVGSHKGEDISSEWSHPHDSMPIARDEPIDASPSSVEPQDEPEDIHEKMYQMAVQKHSPWKGGGSENFLYK